MGAAVAGGGGGVAVFIWVGVGVAVAVGVGVGTMVAGGVGAGFAEGVGSGMSVGAGAAVTVVSGAVVGVSVGGGVATGVGSWVGFAGCVRTGWLSDGAVASGSGVSVGVIMDVGTASEQATRISRASRAVDSSFAMSVDSPFWSVSGSAFYYTSTCPEPLSPELEERFPLSCLAFRGPCERGLERLFPRCVSCVACTLSGETVRPSAFPRGRGESRTVGRAKRTTRLAPGPVLCLCSC